MVERDAASLTSSLHQRADETGAVLRLITTLSTAVIKHALADDGILADWLLAGHFEHLIDA